MDVHSSSSDQASTLAGTICAEQNLARVLLELGSNSSQTIRDLKIFGPGSPSSPVMSLSEAQAYCRRFANSHYENFTVLTRLYPSRFRQHLANIYTFCRWSDDLADELNNQQLSLELLDWWNHKLHQGLQKQSNHPAIACVVDTLQTFQIPFTNLFDLIRAFRDDQIKSRYEDDSEILYYCTGSANPVGRLLLGMAGIQSDEALRFSDSICTGLQIANFCQGIKEDFEKGRIYMPRSRWQNAGINELDFAHGEKNLDLQNALKDWVHCAQMHLSYGTPLIRMVPRWLATNLQMYIRGGFAITHSMEMANFDVWSAPIRISKSKKLQIILRSLLCPRSISGINFPLKVQRGNYVDHDQKLSNGSNHKAL